MYPTQLFPDRPTRPGAARICQERTSHMHVDVHTTLTH